MSQSAQSDVFDLSRRTFHYQEITDRNRMAIPQHTIDQILDRTDIVDLIGQRVKLKKTGRTYSGCCPFHQEKIPIFSRLP